MLAESSYSFRSWLVDLLCFFFDSCSLWPKCFLQGTLLGGFSLDYCFIVYSVRGFFTQGYLSFCSPDDYFYDWFSFPFNSGFPMSILNLSPMFNLLRFLRGAFFKYGFSAYFPMCSSFNGLGYLPRFWRLLLLPWHYYLPISGVFLLMGLIGHSRFFSRFLVYCFYHWHCSRNYLIYLFYLFLVGLFNV